MSFNDLEITAYHAAEHEFSGTIKTERVCGIVYGKGSSFFIAVDLEPRAPLTVEADALRAAGRFNRLLVVNKCRDIV